MLQVSRGPGQCAVCSVTLVSIPGRCPGTWPPVAPWETAATAPSHCNPSTTTTLCTHPGCSGHTAAHYTSSKRNWMPPHAASLQLQHTRDDAHCAHNMTLCAQATGTHTRYTANIGAAVTITITHLTVLHKSMSMFSICNNYCVQ